MRKYSKRTTAAVAVLALASSGVAFAYWTSGGSGTGSAATGTNVPITVNQTTAVTALAPGLAAQALAGTFTNTNAGPAYVGTVTVAVASVFKAGVAATGCDATDYTLVQPAVVNAEVPSGTGGSIRFNNKAATNQDACKGATVNLAYTIS